MVSWLWLRGCAWHRITPWSVPEGQTDRDQVWAQLMQPGAGVFKLCSSSSFQTWSDVTWDLFGYLTRASKGIWFLLTCSPWITPGTTPTEADQGQGPCAFSLVVMHLMSCNWAVELGLVQARAVDVTRNLDQSDIKHQGPRHAG